MSFDFSVHPIFKDVESSALDFVVQGSTVKHYARGAILLGEGGTDLRFFALAKGSVRVFYTDADGRQVVVKLFAAPVAFGEMECIAGLPYQESVEALEKAAGLEVPRHTFLLALRRSPELTYNVTVDLAARLCIAAQNERSLAFNPVERRLATLLHSHATLFGLPTPEGTLIRIPLSQEALAQSLGVARRSITRALRRWSDEGLLKKSKGCFVVSDVARLASYGDPQQLPISYTLPGARHSPSK